MPFNNSIAGGNGSLVRNDLQSPNYVAGVSGWRINKDGSAEFNNGTFRGSLAVGVAPGQRFIVNPGNGDIIDAYSANNDLLFVMDQTGNSTWSQYSAPHVKSLDTQMTGGGLTIFSRTDTSEFDVTFFATPGGVGTQAETDFTCFNNSLVSPHPYELRLVAGSDDGTKGATLLGLERGVTGSIVQTAQTSKNNLFHGDTYAVTTNASGVGTITHGCGFTPAQAVFGGGGGNTIGLFIWATAHTSTTTTVKVFSASGTPFNGTAGIVGLFVG